MPGLQRNRLVASCDGGSLLSSVESTAEYHEQGAAAEVERKWQALSRRYESDDPESN